MSEIIQYIDNGYGVIRLNRPEKHHAITKEMAGLLREILEDAKKGDIPFLVLESSGSESFSAGGDLNEFHGHLSEEDARTRLSVMKNVLKEIITFPVPVISLLHGNAFGGGCELATACDFRIAKEGTKFGFVQSNLGILPGWGGGAILYEKISSSKAYHWITTGNIYNAFELHRIGWIHEVIADKDWHDKKEILKSYSNKSIDQMRLVKQQYLSNLDTALLFSEMDKEVIACASIWESELHQQHVKAFMDR